MITEDQLEQLAIQWHGLGRNIEHRTLNIEHRSEEKRRLTVEREASRALTPAFSQWKKEKERGGTRRLNPAIPEEASATRKDSLSVKIKSKGG